MACMRDIRSISCEKSGGLLTSRIRTGTIFSRNVQRLPPVGGGTQASALVDSTMLYGVGGESRNN